jgi:iron complex outermembrane recepter protein
VLSYASVAGAQRTGENAVTSAEDAFGTSVGNEQIGLYGSSEVRGFSPLDAGNLRIEGFAFDPQGSLGSRLVAGSTVHVGLTAQGYPFPAPTGIVDYHLRPAGDEVVLSLVTGFDDYGGPFLELDSQLPLVPGHLGLAAGASYAHEEYYDGSDARVGSFAIAPRWRPLDGVELRAFYSWSASRDEEVAPLILTGGPFLPPELPALGRPRHQRERGRHPRQRAAQRRMGGGGSRLSLGARRAAGPRGAVCRYPTRRDDARAGDRGSTAAPRFADG